MIDTSARLIAVSYVGELGKMQRVETKTEILCSLDSVGRAEFYAAYASGLRPEYRVTTEPVNYSGEGLIEIDAPEGPIRCDVYRTYRKSPDRLELWCARHNEASVQAFTLWSQGKRVVLWGAYLEGSDSVERTTTGRVSLDTVSLILPQTLQAFSGETPVAYARPKAYAAMTEAQRAEHFTIDSRSFFALGEIEAAGDVKYQAVNETWDDVYLVQQINMRNRGKTGTEFLEVVGR